MNIIKEFIPTCTFDEFADQHGLVMLIKERAVDGKLIGPDARYFAHFKDSDVSEPGVLIGRYGNGASPEKAIEQYARELIGARLVIDAYTPERREIQCPNEWVPA